MSDERKRINERFNEVEGEIEELKKEIANSIKEARELREEKNKVNIQVKELKEKREKQNSITKEKINQFNELRRGINFRERERKRPADVIKNDIDKIEERIETEALKFSEEKRLMKKIGKLKQEYEGAKKEASALDEIGKIENEIIESKKAAEELHKKVQELAQESKNKHNVYLEISKKIKEVNNEQEKAFNNFLKFKEEFNKIGKEVDEKLEALRDAKNKLDGFRRADKKDKDEAEERTLKKKANDVEEKLKRGEKITKEDLIKFQG